MTANNWAYFWHRLWFLYHLKIFWYIGSLPALPAILAHRIERFDKRLELHFDAEPRTIRLLLDALDRVGRKNS